MSDFDIIPSESIAAGDATDAYFDRTLETLEYADKNPNVVAEVTATQFPSDDFRVFSGLKDTAALLEDLSIDVDALSEGTFFDGGPVLRIEGPYQEFCRYETALLGFLSHASGIATRALETRLAAPDSLVLSFGTRHVHPSMAAMIERNALIAGMDGISNVAGGEVIGVEAGGTMPHALVIIFGKGNQEAAWRAFHEAVDETVPRVALCDTYSDEKDEALRAANELGDALESVRLDTTSSRRGDFEHIVQEVRWELDANGYDDIGIFVSGSLDPEMIDTLSSHAEGFGVGGYVSNADPLDFALDIVAVEGEPAAKRGKLSGKKDVYRTSSGDHVVKRADEKPPEDGDSLLEPIIRDGDIVTDFSIEQANNRIQEELDIVDFSVY
ncbi:MAG: nicotinate phosphoribosyltransferase [Halobacteriaceae archaeon]